MPATIEPDAMKEGLAAIAEADALDPEELST
jgi:hypothetical protein